jgi:hypothetical protein
MIQEITTRKEVEIFAQQLIEEGTLFHPDDDFLDCINSTTYATTYSEIEAKHRNQLMIQCFDVCSELGIDIYQLMGGILHPQLN